MPTGYRRKIAQAIDLARLTVAPADTQSCMVALSRLLRWIETFGVITLPADVSARAKAMDAVMDGYVSALSDLPGDLLVEAVAETIRTHKHRTLPLPGDIREKVAAEKTRRLTLLLQLEIAEQFGKFQDPPDEPRLSREEARERFAAIRAATMATITGLAAPPRSDGRSGPSEAMEAPDPTQSGRQMAAALWSSVLDDPRASETARETARQKLAELGA